MVSDEVLKETEEMESKAEEVLEELDEEEASKE